MNGKLVAAPAALPIFRLVAGVALALLLACSITLPACAPAAVPRAAPAAAASGPEVVHVAPPTGEREADRASILAALERVRPSGTVQFAPGTYLVGPIIRIDTPGITLLGHPEGTTLRGCSEAELDEVEREADREGDPRALLAVLLRCGNLELTGGHVTVRDFTFENTRMGLLLGCCHAELAFRPSEGGYRIENNIFRDSGNAIRALLSSPEPTVIRGNRFINVFHALSAGVSHLRMLDNDISVPEPERVAGRGHPGFGIGIWPISGDLACEHNLIAGNRIEGHETGIVLFGESGLACRQNVIRDNTIIVRRVPFDPARWPAGAVDITDPADSTIVGVPLTLHNPGGEGRVEHNLIEGNRIFGAEGIGIEILHASGNRIVNNIIGGIRRRDPFPGNTLGGNPQRWAIANGSGIWVSPGSEGNEILGNVFEDVASHAVVIEGNRNRVEIRAAADQVVDRGAGNRVSGGAGSSAPDAGDTVRSRFFHSDSRRLHYLDFGGDGLPLVFVPALDRSAETFRDFAARFTDRHRVLAITNRGSGESEGEVRDRWDTAGKARDVVALLDTLGIERAVVVGRWADVPVYLGENHADRVAGIVILSPQEAGPSWPALGAQDPTGVLAMIDRWGLAAVQGLDPDQPAPWHEDYEPGYLRSGAPVAVPALAFRPVGSRGSGAADPTVPFQLAEMARANPESFPDPVSREWFRRLHADSTLQAEVRAFYDDIVNPAVEAVERMFRDAFGGSLTIEPLEVEGPITGYEYRDQPDRFEAAIRRFLGEVQGSGDR